MFRRNEATETIPVTSGASFFASNVDADGLPPEIEEGNVEYKLKLIDPPPERLEHLVTQMKWRLAEGYGEAMYEVGVSDKGGLVGLTPADLAASIDTLRRMGQALRADVSIIRERQVSADPVRMVAEVLVRKCLTDDQHFLEVRVAIVGPADAGKSTLLGVLTHSEKDNGRGKSRLNLLRHRHEIESGRTSSISHQIIGFDPRGELINYATTNVSSWEQICETAAKIVTFLDTCGHPKYQKTTISGLTGHAPDYACLIVGANAGGLSEIGKEHLGIAVVLKVPVFVVLTKIDVATPEQLTRTIGSLLSLLKTPGIRRVPIVIQNEDDLIVSVSSFVSSRVVPIFLTSSVTGDNLPLLTKFLNLLPKPVRDHEKLLEEEVEYQTEEIYSVPDVGCVLGGVLLSGRINVSLPSSASKVYFIGPDRGRFVPVRVTSIHRQRCPVNYMKAGQAASCALTFLSPEAPGSEHSATGTFPPPGFKLRKGQVLLGGDGVTMPQACWEFEADINVLYHAGAIQEGCHGVLYIDGVRQGAKVIRIDPPSPATSPVVTPTRGVPPSVGKPGNLSLRTGDRGRVRFRFAYEPEWVKKGGTVLFRGEGRMKCVGKVAAVSFDARALFFVKVLKKKEKLRASKKHLKVHLSCEYSEGVTTI
ncbi:GTP binding protein [Borealophlyctis nickersoniae]|nr:GTP binding protein [Borealophlyctis nickersoniae]